MNVVILCNCISMLLLVLIIVLAFKTRKRVELEPFGYGWDYNDNIAKVYAILLALNITLTPLTIYYIIVVWCLGLEW